MKKKQTKEVPSAWLPFPQKDFGAWMGEWMISSLAVKVLSKKAAAKEFRLIGTKKRKDGGLDVNFEWR